MAAVVLLLRRRRPRSRARCVADEILKLLGDVPEALECSLSSLLEHPRLVTELLAATAGLLFELPGHLLRGLAHRPRLGLGGRGRLARLVLRVLAMLVRVRVDGEADVARVLLRLGRAPRGRRA